MKRFLKLLTLTVLVFCSVSCGKKVDTAAADPVWDRQICDQCKMILSNRNFAAQVINLDTGKRLYFDDIGCALRYLATEKMTPFSEKIILYATNANTGKWVDLKNGRIIKGYVTPMSSSFGVIDKDESISKDKKEISLKEAFDIYQSKVQGKAYQ